MKHRERALIRPSRASGPGSQTPPKRTLGACSAPGSTCGISGQHRSAAKREGGGGSDQVEGLVELSVGLALTGADEVPSPLRGVGHDHPILFEQRRRLDASRRPASLSWLRSSPYTALGSGERPVEPGRLLGESPAAAALVTARSALSWASSARPKAAETSISHSAMTVAGFGSDRGAAVGPLRTAVPAQRAIPTTTIAPVHSDTLSATLGRCARRGAGEPGRAAVRG